MKRLGLVVAVATLGFAAPAGAQVLDVNTATADQLSALIGQRAYTDAHKAPNWTYCKQNAARIVAARPLQKLADLVTRNVVSNTLYGVVQRYLRVGAVTPAVSPVPTPPVAPVVTTPVAPVVPPATAAALPFPKFVDITSKQSPVRNQARRNTCIPFSTTAGVEAFDRTLDLSEELLYYLLREQDADKKKCLKILWDAATPDICDDKCSGATLEDAVKVLQTVGLYEEASWPYDSADNQTAKVSCHESATWASKAVSVQGKKTVKLGPVVWLAGPGEQPKSKRVDDPMVLMAILAQGYAVNIAIDCAGGGWHGGLNIDVELDPVTKKPAKAEGGHGLLLVGYDYDKKLFKFKNSWDSDWGDKGYGYMTFDYLKTYIYGGYYATGIKK